jgi:hypothetical protein
MSVVIVRLIAGFSRRRCGKGNGSCIDASKERSRTEFRKEDSHDRQQGICCTKETAAKEEGEEKVRADLENHDVMINLEIILAIENDRARARLGKSHRHRLHSSHRNRYRLVKLDISRVVISIIMQWLLIHQVYLALGRRSFCSLILHFPSVCRQLATSIIPSSRRLPDLKLEAKAISTREAGTDLIRVASIDLYLSRILPLRRHQPL